MTHPPDHEVFQLTAYPDGVIDLAVCWEQIDGPGVAKALREIADGLDHLPPGARADGVAPLRSHR